ncbi:MAG: UDP-N-acetylglucosamine 1-carboxyvinyltransferase, partial [Myxococcota bacterium]|nr:UDP-N-acetylglucosamine 1-carboxyvinyltransferase [Myxococcota bacterium]
MGASQGDRFVVEGGRPVEGVLEPAGNKNEALPVLAASLLARGAVRLGNVPRIRDVTTLAEMLRELGVAVDADAGASALHVDAATLSAREPSDLGHTIRGSFLLAPGLLHRTGQAVLPRPGGDRIGRRRLDTHM